MQKQTSSIREYAVRYCSAVLIALGCALSAQMANADDAINLVGVWNAQMDGTNLVLTFHSNGDCVIEKAGDEAIQSNNTTSVRYTLDESQSPARLTITMGPVQGSGGMDFLRAIIKPIDAQNLKVKSSRDGMPTSFDHAQNETAQISVWTRVER